MAVVGVNKLLGDSPGALPVEMKTYKRGKGKSSIRIKCNVLLDLIGIEEFWLRAGPRPVLDGPRPGPTDLGGRQEKCQDTSELSDWPKIKPRQT